MASFRICFSSVRSLINLIGLSVLMSCVALRIHISSITADILKATRLFQLENRGERQVKVLTEPYSVSDLCQHCLSNYQYSCDYPVTSLLPLLHTSILISFRLLLSNAVTYGLTVNYQ